MDIQIDPQTLILDLKIYFFTFMKNYDTEKILLEFMRTIVIVLATFIAVTEYFLNVKYML